jgi:hypothetical protein
MCSGACVPGVYDSLAQQFVCVSELEVKNPKDAALGAFNVETRQHHISVSVVHTLQHSSRNRIERIKIDNGVRDFLFSE